MLRTLFLITSVLLALAAKAGAQDTSLEDIIADFAEARKFSQVEDVIERLAATGDPRAALTLRSLSDGTLMARTTDGRVLVVEGEAPNLMLRDAVSGEALERGPVEASDFQKIKIKNSLRRKIAAALSGLTLKANSSAVRLTAARTIFEQSDASALEALDEALQTETDSDVRSAFIDARASALLATDASLAEKSDAIDIIAARGDRAALALLSAYANAADGELKTKLDAGITEVEESLAAWSAAQNIWYGISLGSVLLLAAIGLAITFGVMGVINMAHGEMVMLGAYTTFAVQEVFRTSAPGLFDYSLLVAVPLAFLVSGTIGVIMERGLIRFLYGRPLETLLATWGVSLILQQSVRTLFGPTNREVGNPSWMSGAFEIGQMSITWNRLWIVVFAAVVFAALYLIINRSALGLEMRAVTQNRRMAGAMGIRTSWVDAMTFGLGSGIAGIAGVALSQIDNVSPNLGQSYIIDSFLVVVFGGVGNLWGTLVGAMTLGIANKFLEPYTGAVLGKILVLVLIILFIQKRPRGLFALKGRAVET
ncbi:MAG: urea ABC transporter permease subunit UrtB [Hoeflea sp.]|uniref:urea ABC transporter permease subunit UrtB n=1 Tax=Hoeflea sp. TaxID=1940281 RepID=UPI003EF90E9B